MEKQRIERHNKETEEMRQELEKKKRWDKAEQERFEFEEKKKKTLRQIQPPPSTYRVMYPNPMRHPEDVDVCYFSLSLSLSLYI